MSQALAQPFDCRTVCVPSGTSSTPGEQGPAGENGTNGVDGINARTLSVDGDDVMPAEGGSVTINTSSSTAFLAVGENAYVQFWGYLEVSAKPSTTSVTLVNLEDTASDTYAGNAAPGTILPAGAYIVPGGLQGPAGETPAGALLASNNLNDVDSNLEARTNLGLGTAATHSVGVANGDLPPVDTTFTNGDAVFATASGVQTKTAGNARTALGLGTMATQAASAVAITGGTIVTTALNGTLGATTPSSAAVTTLAASGNVSLAGKLFATSSAIQSLLAATAVSPDATKIRVVGNGGAVVLVATPTITAPAADGQILVIMGTNDTNTVTFQDESSLAGTKLQLNGGNDRVLGLYDTLTLMYDSSTGFWVELAFSDN